MNELLDQSKDQPPSVIGTTDLRRLAEEPVQFCPQGAFRTTGFPSGRLIRRLGDGGSLPLWYHWGSREL